jgi:hypothetical protein
MKPTKSHMRILALGMLPVLAVCLIGGWMILKKAGLLSPGRLSAVNESGETLGGYVSHADFEQECGHCHAPVHCITDTRCQDCHLDVARQRAAAEGIHGSLPTENCEYCHREHQGHDAVITAFAFNNVDHQKLANFSLAHHKQNYDGEPFNCESCHQQGSYMDGSLDCLTCHIEHDHDGMAEHIDVYGLDCLKCHDGTDRMSEFDHNRFYLLDGSHAEADCQDCHANQTYAQPYRTCLDCHPEPELHAGVFGTSCERCHGTTAWAPAELKEHTFLIDHGGEGPVDCETCHAGTYTDYPCYTCHAVDEMYLFHNDRDIYAYENCIECHPTGREGEGEQAIQIQVPPERGEQNTASGG